MSALFLSGETLQFNCILRVLNGVTDEYLHKYNTIKVLLTMYAEELLILSYNFII